MSGSLHPSVADRVGDVVLPALDCLRVAISIFDASDRLIYCNEHFRYIYRSFGSVEALIGVEFGELLRLLIANREIANAVSMDDADLWIAERMAQRRDTRAAPFEHRLTDGRWIAVKERPLAAGGFIGLWQDITDLKRAQIAVEDAIHSTSDGFALWDHNDRLVLANPSFLQFHGSHSAVSADRPRFRAVLEAAVSDGQFRLEGDPLRWMAQRLKRDARLQQETVVQHRTGRWLLIKDRRTRDGGSVTVMTDITDHKENELELIRRGKSLERTVQELEMVQIKLEENGQALAEMAEELQIAKVMAEQSSASKSVFLSNMSHELRTPLNAIIGFAELIRDGVLGPVGNDKYREYAGDIHTAGTHLLALINDILDLAKIEAGRMEMDRRPLIIAEAVNATVRLIAPKAAERGLVVETEFSPDCRLLLADERAFKQALLNLLSNAVKFTQRGGRLGVRVQFGTDGGTDISVWDTGVGIASKDLPRVMQRFEQARDPMVADSAGTGLGLAIVQSLMELHGGRLYLQSERGKGTIATLAFPAPEPSTARVHTLERLAAQ